MILAGTTLLRAEQSNVEKIQKKILRYFFLHLSTYFNFRFAVMAADTLINILEYFRGRVPALDSFLGQGIEIFTK